MDKSSSGGAEASLGSLASKPKIEHHKSIRKSPLQVHGIGQFYVGKLCEEMVNEECPKQKCLSKHQAYLTLPKLGQQKPNTGLNHYSFRKGLEKTYKT